MQKLFTALGLNKKETQVFLTLLELGAQPISVLAKNVHIPRPSVYLIIEKLQKKRLVETFPRSGITFVKTIPPENIQNVLEQEKHKIIETENLLEQSLPDLKKLENKLSITPKVTFYEGTKQVEKIYDQLLKQTFFCAIFNPHLVKKTFPHYHFRIGTELKRNRGCAKELLIACAEANEYQDKFQSTRHQIKILPKNIDFPTDTIITSGKVFLVSYGEKQISATEIQNQSIAKTQEIMFEELWKKF